MCLASGAKGRTYVDADNLGESLKATNSSKRIDSMLVLPGGGIRVRPAIAPQWSRLYCHEL